MQDTAMSIDDQPSEGPAADAPVAPKRPRIRYRTPPLHLTVLDRLRAMILDGEVASGAHLVESSLCKTLKVSRTPLREAMKVLAMEGLVEFSPHRGTRVTVMTGTEVRELFETIAGLESLAAELATLRMRDEALAELEAMHERMLYHFGRGERQQYFALNSDIHRRIVALADNSVLRETHERLTYRANRGRYLAILSPERWQQAVEEHEAVMAAFRDRNPPQSARVWRTHMIHTGQEVEKLLRPDAADGQNGAS